MAKIDVSQWGEFKVGDLFDWFHGRRRNRNELELSPFDIRDDSVAYITAGFESQGIIGEVGLNYLANDQLETYINAITIDMFGNCFFHNYKVAGDDNVYFLINDERSINQMLFVSAVINSVTSSKFGYKNQFRQHNLLELQIKLPIISDGNPDWEYMDNYIVELDARAHKDVSLLNQVNLKPHKINIDNWKTFKVGDLFERVSLSFHGNGTRKDYISEVQDDTHQLPLLGAKKGNNGIVYYGDSTVFDSIDKCIGVVQNGAASAGLVYPEYDLFGVYTDAYAIKLQNGSELTNESILFVSAVLQKLLFSKYSYYNKCTWSKVQVDTIQLPVYDDGQPNFDYMAKYIEMMQASAKCCLQSYHNVDRVDK